MFLKRGVIHTPESVPSVAFTDFSCWSLPVPVMLCPLARRGVCSAQVIPAGFSACVPVDQDMARAPLPWRPNGD